MSKVYIDSQVQYGGNSYLDFKMQPVATLSELASKFDPITDITAGMIVTVLNDGTDGKPHEYQFNGTTWVKKDDFYNKLETELKLAEKQDELISSGASQNIKTINGQSILGSGNIEISGGTGGTSYYPGTNIDITNHVISVTGMNEAIASAVTDMATKTWVEGKGYLTEHQDISGKVDKQITGTNGSAYIFNESDGGGAQFIHNDTSEAYIGVNDGGKDGLMAQIYADMPKVGGGWSGSRINVYNKGIFYQSKESTDDGKARDAAELEIAVKGDLANKADKATTLSGYGITDAVKMVNSLRPDANGNVEVKTFSDITDSRVRKNTTLKNFCNDVLQYINPKSGTAFLTGVAFSDLPQGIHNAELFLYVPVQGVYTLELTTTNAYDDEGNGGKFISIYDRGDIKMSWEGFMTCPKDTSGKFIPRRGADGTSKYYVDGELAKKQNTLVSSGTNQNIKTINGQSILGSGNIEISGGTGVEYQAGANIDITNHVISVSGMSEAIASAKSETQAWVEAKGYLTEHQDISGKLNVLPKVDDPTDPGYKYPYWIPYDAQFTPTANKLNIKLRTLTLDNNLTKHDWDRELSGATTSMAGLMTAEDKVKLDNVKSAVLTSAITTDIAVGHVSAGTTYAVGTSIEKILRDIFMSNITKENVTLSLTVSGEGSSMSDINGAVITVTESGKSPVNYTWNGNPISVNINDGIVYSVSYGNVSGYNTPTSQSYTAVGQTSRTVSANYEKQQASVKYYYTTAQDEKTVWEVFVDNGWVNSGFTATNYDASALTSAYFTRSTNPASTSTFNLTIPADTTYISVVIPEGFALSTVKDDRDSDVTDSFNIVQENIMVSNVKYKSHTFRSETGLTQGTFKVTFKTE